MGHLRKNQDRYANTEDTRRYCCKDSSEYIGEQLRRKGDLSQNSFKDLKRYLMGEEIEKKTLDFT